MGEYATRIKDGERVKLGSCEDLFYCRWNQRYDVTDFPGTMERRFWHLPFPDEDYIPVGDFEDYEGWKRNYYSALHQSFAEKLKEEENIMAKPGSVTLRHEESGLQVRIPCFHGIKLPDNIGDCAVTWNGYCFPVRMAAVKNYEKELRIVAGCTACGRIWSFSFDEIQQYILSYEMRMRLLKSCQAYWNDTHPDDEPSGYVVSDQLVKRENGKIEMKWDSGEDLYQILIDGKPSKQGHWSEMKRVYLEELIADRGVRYVDLK